eukprot:gene5965-11318_t
MEAALQEIYEETINKIKEDRSAAEFKIAMFSAALLSYRKNSCLLPFPPAFTENDGTKNIHNVEDVFSQLPSVQEFISHPSRLSREAVTLLHWIISERSYAVESCKEDLFKELEQKTGKSSFSIKPDYMFEIKYLNSYSSRKFDEYGQSYNIKFGYHGSRLDNFYSILHNGLQVHMTKNALFGEGVYLSEDVAVTLPYSKTGDIWKHSSFGHQMSCIAVCEIVDHPLVKCKVKNGNQSRSRAKDTQAGDVPEKYFVVTSSDLLRLKYVLKKRRMVGNQEVPSSIHSIFVRLVSISDGNLEIQSGANVLQKILGR